MASRVLRAGHDLTVYNRTRSKVEPLLALGAKAADSVSELASCDIVFITVASSGDLLAVLGGDSGLLSAKDRPEIVVDCSTVSGEASAEARAAAGAAGVQFLAAPVSGNPRVADSGRLTMVVSGPKESYEIARPYLKLVVREATYVGEGELARLVKLCHNLFLGVVIQSLAEITILAEKGGVRRADFLTFLNDSVMGSAFSRYKMPALVNLDFHPTFTTHLLRKDFDLGLGAARELDVPMPVAGAVHQRLGEAIGYGYGNEDFAALVEIVARGAGMEIASENAPVTDGLDPTD